MPSEDSKPVKKKEVVVEDEDEDDKKSLGSIMMNCKKKLVANNGTSASKSHLKETRVKKEEPLDYDSDKPIRIKKESKVKKEKNVEEDDGDHDDDKPIVKRVSTIKPDKVFSDFYLL